MEVCLRDAQSQQASTATRRRVQHFRPPKHTRTDLHKAISPEAVHISTYIPANVSVDAAQSRCAGLETIANELQHRRVPQLAQEQTEVRMQLRECRERVGAIESRELFRNQQQGQLQIQVQHTQNTLATLQAGEQQGIQFSNSLQTDLQQSKQTLQLQIDNLKESLRSVQQLLTEAQQQISELQQQRARDQAASSSAPAQAASPATAPATAAASATVRTAPAADLLASAAEEGHPEQAARPRQGQRSSRRRRGGASQPYSAPPRVACHLDCQCV